MKYIKLYEEFINEASISMPDNEQLYELLNNNKQRIINSLTDNKSFLSCIQDILNEFKNIKIWCRTYKDLTEEQLKNQFYVDDTTRKVALFNAKVIDIFGKTIKILTGEKRLLFFYKKYDFGLLGASFNESASTLRIFSNLELNLLFISDSYKKLKKDISKIDIFIELIVRILSHELVHIKDFSKGELDFTQKDYDLKKMQLGTEKKTKYFGDIREIHAHAYNTIKEFTDIKLNKEQINKILNSTKRVNGGNYWNKYLKHIKQNKEKFAYYIEKCKEYLNEIFK